ncbi:MAG: hypothetical protein OXC11_01275 [Rhodospirillales bacterium]|nr:hypothetical protein [Rhodospirillales bacterium]
MNRNGRRYLIVDTAEIFEEPAMGRSARARERFQWRLIDDDALP